MKKLFQRCSNLLKTSLRTHEGVMNEALLKRRVDEYYVPIYMNLRSSMLDHREKKDTPLFVGISAPQGCGKTTLVEYMETLFAEEGYKCVTMSLDDFYLPYNAQASLAAANPSNPMLAYRGNAGSHDMPLLLSTLQDLKNNQDVMVPRYDKKLQGGWGDRAPRDQWRVVEQELGSDSIDIMLFEGWMLGFQGISEEKAQSWENGEEDSGGVDMKGIVDVNRILKNEDVQDNYRNMHEMFDKWLVLQLDDVMQVYKWRLDAEKAQGNGLSDQQVHDFVARFMPAYVAYLPQLYKNDESGGPHRRCDVGISDILSVVIGSDRLPTTPVQISLPVDDK